MLLYLMRHGEAEQAGASDAARELNRQGMLANRAVVQKFGQQSPMIERALMSPYQRARQTATSMRAILPTLRFEVSQDLIPDASPYDLLDKIEQMNVMQLLLVSHNPLISNFLALLVDGTLETDRAMGTSHLACVSLDLVAPGCGELKYTLTP